MGEIISSRDGKSEVNIYYLHEFEKVEGGCLQPLAETNVRSL
jgi:hypothetical protein